MQKRRNDWSIRLEQELEISESAWFVTLTYNDRHAPVGDGCLSLDKRDVQLFMKRLRKNNKDKKIRYYLVGEYGENTHRPHYHAILFNVTHNQMEMYDEVRKAWKTALKREIGDIHLGKVTPASIAYVTKYCIQLANEVVGKEKPFALMSRRPGIGINYIKTHERYHKKDSEKNYITSTGGIRRPLPRYYREKIYNKFTRSLQNVKQQKKADEVYNERKRNYEKLKQLRKYGKAFEQLEIEKMENFEATVKKSMKNRKEL